MSNVRKVSEELKKNFVFDEDQIFSIDSSDLEVSHLDSLKKHILSKEETGEYSGYVIVHGTDTMEYTGSYLSLTMPGVRKPIVLTGSMISTNEKATDGFHNLHNAIVTSQQDLIGVFITFGKYSLQANKTSKQNPDSFDAFASVGYEPAYDIQYKNTSTAEDIEQSAHDSPKFSHLFQDHRYIFMQNGRILENLKKFYCANIHKQLTTLKNINTNVGHIRLFPGFQYDMLDQYIDRKTDGLLIEGYGDGNMPQHTTFMDKIRKLLDNNTLIVIKSQCPQGELTHKYAGGKQLLSAGAMSAQNLTTGTTIMKLMLVLGEKQGNRKQDLDHSKMLFGEHYAGELLV